MLSKYIKIVCLTMLYISLSISSGCSEDESSTNNGDINLTGLWERSFERNGATGIQQFEFTSTSELRIYEIGNYLIMNEWYSGLPDGVTYKLWTEPASPISTLTSDTIVITEVTGSAHIINNSTGVEVATWSMTRVGTQFNYQITNNGNTLIITIGATSLEFSKS